MTFGNLNTRLGLVALFLAAFLAFHAIPAWVFSPANVQRLVLAPAFWPYILAGFLALTGLGLLLSPAPEDAGSEPDAATDGAWLRLAGLAAIMALTMFALPRLGMVWTSMLAFVATAFLFGTRYRRTAVVCAVLVPLGLYMFFAHVAGVAVPQGDFVRLP